MHIVLSFFLPNEEHILLTVNEYKY